MAKAQVAKLPIAQPIVMIFTPTSWLLPRPTYQGFRKIWDEHFTYETGFIVTSNEFFKLDGKWPLAFTIWKYRGKPIYDSKNTVTVKDLTTWQAIDLNINWDGEEENLEKEVKKLLKGKKEIKLDNTNGYIKDWTGQSMYDFKRDRTKEELQSSSICGGLSIKDERRNNKKTYGVANSEFIGFMDDVTPCRVKQDKQKRHSNKPDRIWFRLDVSFVDLNKAKCFGLATDQKAYCAYDLPSAKGTCTWFAITKALNGKYPVWANQYDVWPPKISKKHADYWYSLCFAFVLAENRCVVTKFEKDNPVKDAPEVFVDNPLSTNNKESFWNTTLKPTILVNTTMGGGIANELVEAITDLYTYWNQEYCKGQTIEHVGLKQEAYFKYFSYPDFVTPNSGLIQIKKYAEVNSCTDLLNKFTDIQKLTSEVKKELYKLLVEEFGYFE